MARQVPTSIRLHAIASEPLRVAGHDDLATEELTAILAALPYPVIVLDRDKRVVAYSGPLDPKDVIGRDAGELLAVEDGEFHQRQIRRVLDGGETVSYDVELGHSSAEPGRWVRVRLAPLAVGGDIRGVVCMWMNIEHERAVERRAERLRATFDHVDEGLLVVDLTTGNVIECNEAAAKLLQVPPEELTDTAPAWLQLAPDAGARLGWGALLDELMEGRSVRGRAILREGQEINMELRATSRKLDGNSFAFVLCRDISADLVSERARATQERLATVGSLAAGVAHEINNPLAYVIANVQFALDTIAVLPLGEPAQETAGAGDMPFAVQRAQLKEALFEANEGAHRVQRIVRDLKTLARQGDDRLEPISVERTLNWAIGVTMAEIRHRARLVKGFEQVSSVRGDEARLGQVFVNILLNAAQAIEPGNASENEIIVSTRERDGRVVVEVSDSGMGIPPENLTKIFDPFFTTKPRGIGTGLGLSICHEIIAMMRGTLTAENRSPHGAKFVVEIPALTAYHSAGPQPRKGKSVRPPVRSARILVIDDESLAAKALGRMLRDHQVDLADHAPTGLKMALENDYDVIFCDLMMPELSGMAVHAAVEREAPEVAERMVFITGGTFTEEARDFAAHHSARCLFKPFDSALVKGAVERLLLGADPA